MNPEFTDFNERIAVHYEAWYETPSGQRAGAHEKGVLQRLLQHFPQAHSVLEVGAGTGHFTRWFRAKGLATVGLDLSKAMLTQAEILNGVTLVNGDACQLPFARNAFDLVAFITTLEFLPCPRKALSEGLRVARQGLFLGVLNRWSSIGLRRRLVGLFRPTIYDSAHFYSVGELEQLLRSVADDNAHIVWRTTLFPCTWPLTQLHLSWGGFIGMALVLSSSVDTEELS